MTDAEGHWAHVDQIFSAALDLPQHEREAFVRERCAADAKLLDELLELLRAANDDGFLTDSRADIPIEGALAEAVRAARGPAEGTDPLVGSSLGSYEIVRALAQGGMGNVYLARRREGFEQHVAIKTLKRGIDTDDVVRRFLAERQILAQLDHPNIARLYDGGSTPDGRPYFVMEFVRGKRITTYADERRLAPSERLELLKTVAAALQHAHQHLVVHRDLKPSNVFVTHDGVVKLLDFGIARLIGSEHQWGQTRTSTGFRLLTPAFAAPEQVLREPTTTATDVYQTGALAYELLSGARPFASDLSEPELERQIVEVDPEPASEAVRRAAVDAPSQRGFATAKALSLALRGDLDTILTKALAKEPERRYASVDAMAADFDRHLEGRPIAARPATPGYRFGRFARRNRWFLPAAAAAVLALSAYVESSIRHSRELTAERNVALDEADRAEAVTVFLADVFTSPNPWAGGEGSGVTVVEVLDDAVSRVETEFADRPELQARLFDVIGASYHSLSRFEAAERVQRQAVALRSVVPAVDGIEGLESLRALGLTVYSTQGPDSALAVLEPVLAAVESPTSVRERHLQAEVLGSLARVRWGLSEFDSAFSLFDRAEAAFAALDPPSPVGRGAVMRLHARALSEADRYDEGVTLAERAVSLLASALPDDHIELAAARQELGSALSNPGQQRQAAAIVELDKALRVYEKRLEPNDPSILSVRYDKAYALLNLERMNEAEAEFRVLAELHASRDPNSRDYGDALQNLAATLKRQGRLDEAVATAMQAHDVYKRALGQHYLVAYPLLTVAEVELDRGRFAQGERLGSDAYEILRQTLPPDHFATWVARCRRGRGRWGSGKTAEGLEDLRASSAALLESTLGPEHAYTLECTQAFHSAEAVRAAGTATRQ